MVFGREGSLEESAVDWAAVQPGRAEGAGAPASGDACAAELRIPKVRPASADPASPGRRAGVAAEASSEVLGTSGLPWWPAPHRCKLLTLCDTQRPRAQVALMFLTRGVLHHEAIWAPRYEL